MILGLDPGPVETAAVNRRCALCHVPIYGIKTKRYCSNKCKGAAWQGQKYMAEYWGKNPIKRKEYQRRARISENGGKLSYEIIPRLIAKQKGLCAICNFPLPLKGYHVDHVIPLFHKGKNEDGNIQITCPGCNIRKGKKLCV